MAERLMSPTGGFLLQGRGGSTGNFEVVFAWPGAGLAHYFRDNDASGLPWHGPYLFGVESACYIGATAIESDFKAHNRTMGNLEVLATSASGELHHFWRENGGDYAWHGPYKVADNVAHAPSMAYTGRQQSGVSKFCTIAPNAGTGFQYRERRNMYGYVSWAQQGGAGTEPFQGVALALTTIGAADPYVLYRDVGLGRRVVAAVCRTGNLHLYMEGMVNGGGDWGWTDSAIIGRNVFAEHAHSFRGRPSLIQGTFGYEDPPFAFGWGHYGNLELIAPHRHGGFMHFHRICGLPMHAIEPISWGWGGGFHVRGPMYDEVSMIQSTFSGGKHGNLEVVARRLDQTGFDFWWRDAQWHGPYPIG